MKKIINYIKGLLQMYKKKIKKPTKNGGFPGGSVIRNPPANAGDTGLIRGPGRFHMPWSN